MNLYKKIKEKLQEKKGSAVIEFTLGLLIFTMLLAFTVDLLFIGGKRFNIGQEATDTARILAKQGGVLQSAPEGYPGGEKAYLNTTEMLGTIENRMLKSGLGSYDEGVWKVTLTEYDTNGNILRSGELKPDTHFDVDYMHSLDVRIQAKYHWNFLKMVGGDSISETEIGAIRHAVSEFKYDFDTWEGEQY